MEKVNIQVHVEDHKGAATDFKRLTKICSGSPAFAAAPIDCFEQAVATDHLKEAWLGYGYTESQADAVVDTARHEWETRFITYSFTRHTEGFYPTQHADWSPLDGSLTQLAQLAQLLPSLSACRKFGYCRLVDLGGA